MLGFVKPPGYRQTIRSPEKQAHSLPGLIVDFGTVSLVKVKLTSFPDAGVLLKVKRLEDREVRNSWTASTGRSFSPAVAGCARLYGEASKGPRETFQMTNFTSPRWAMKRV